MASEGVHLNSEGMQRKLRNLQSVVRFFENVHKDGISWMLGKELKEVLNGRPNTYVGVISGNLRRSQTVVPINKFTTLLFTNITVAPYALRVLAWSEQRYGRNFLKITLDLFGQELINTVDAEWEHALETINQGKEYVYHNPFKD